LKRVKLTLKEFLNQNDLRNSVLGIRGSKEVPDHARRQSKITEFSLSHYLLNRISKPLLGQSTKQPDKRDDPPIPSERKVLLGFHYTNQSNDFNGKYVKGDLHILLD